MLKALLVDFDGTLVDTQAANVEAYFAAIAEEGLVTTREQLGLFVGRMNWQAMLPSVLKDLPPDRARSIAERKRRLYPKFLSEVSVNQTLVDLIRSLSPPLACALVTSASRDSVNVVLAATNLRDLFSLVITSDDCARHKPDPEPFALAASRLSVEPHECLIFEDSDVGVAAARAFGAAVHIVNAPF